MAKGVGVSYYLIGGRGRLGRFLADEYAPENIEILDRSIYSDWARPGRVDSVARFFDDHSNNGATVLVAAGLIDPNFSREDLFNVNYHLPKNLLDSAERVNIKIITFGSVMEGLLHRKNPYIESKAILGEYVSSLAVQGVQALHIQIHTLFGGCEPSSSMFLGQMLKALRAEDSFKMTSGLQLREYHHLEDESKAIRQIIGTNVHGIFNLSHGKPVMLRSIAESVFEAFGKQKLLQLSALPEPMEDNYNQTLKISVVLSQIEFRDSLPAIVRYMLEVF